MKFQECINTPEIRIDCDDDKKFLLIENVTKVKKKLKKILILMD